jgi:hypothetical protein
MLTIGEFRWPSGKTKSKTASPQKVKPCLDDIDPFLEFKEWTSAADEKANKNL